LWVCCVFLCCCGLVIGFFFGWVFFYCLR
jgi:hypothetical protein